MCVCVCVWDGWVRAGSLLGRFGGMVKMLAEVYPHHIWNFSSSTSHCSPSPSLSLSFSLSVVWTVSITLFALFLSLCTHRIQFITDDKMSGGKTQEVLTKFVRQMLPGRGDRERECVCVCDGNRRTYSEETKRSEGRDRGTELPLTYSLLLRCHCCDELPAPYTALLEHEQNNGVGHLCAVLRTGFRVSGMIIIIIIYKCLHCHRTTISTATTIITAAAQLCSNSSVHWNRVNITTKTKARVSGLVKRRE